MNFHFNFEFEDPGVYIVLIPRRTIHWFLVNLENSIQAIYIDMGGHEQNLRSML